MKDMLSATMLSETMDLHEKAERCGYIEQMVQSRITRPAYRLLLVDLYHIYTALEEELEKNKDNPVLGSIYCPDELYRQQALVEDLQFFYGRDWMSKVHPTNACLEYVKYIHHIGKTEPALLLAHAFVRYLGDLSGGQILKFKMTRCMSLPASGEGVHFYQFDKVKNATRLKNYLVARINNLELEAERFDRLVKEARNAFQLNINVFEELETIAVSLMMNGPTHEISWKIRCFSKIWEVSTVALCFVTLYSMGIKL